MIEVSGPIYSTIILKDNSITEFITFFYPFIMSLSGKQESYLLYPVDSSNTKDFQLLTALYRSNTMISFLPFRKRPIVSGL